MKISNLILLATTLAFMSISRGQRPGGGGPGRGGGKGGMMVTCKTPTAANAANCNVEKAKTIGGACAKQLYKDCAAKKLGFDRANSQKGPGSKRGGYDGPNKRPGPGSGRGACKTPTVANAANCNLEKAKTIDRACVGQLHRDCVAKKLGFDGPGSGSGRGLMICKTPAVANATSCNLATVKTLSMGCATRLYADCAKKRLSFGHQRPGQSCKTPTVANAANCNVEKANTIGHYCARQLHIDCAKKDLAFDPPGPGAFMTCKTPTVANAANCNVEKAKTIGRACAKQLHKDCAAKKLAFDPPPARHDSCSGITATNTTCTSKGFAAVFNKSPWCLLRLRGLCQRWRMGHPAEPSIPKGCSSWFDGCNRCQVTKTGTKGKCTKVAHKKFCFRRRRPYCREFADGRKCWQMRSKRSNKPFCRSKDGAVTKPPSKPITCVDIASDTDMSEQEVCRKAFFLCASGVLEDCRTKKAQEEKAACERLKETDERKKGACCVQGKLSGDVCKRFGGPDKLPTDCKTRCYDNGKFKRDVKECVRCRGKGSLGANDGNGGKPADKAAKQPFDPARVRDTIKEIASKLNEGGKTCVKRVATATSKLKTQIQRWYNNNPSQKEEPKEQTEIKALSKVQSEIDETAESSKKLEDEFEDDAEGKAHRAKADSLGQRLQDKISDANKPNKCGTQFDALKTAVNAIVEDYSNLPAKLKSQRVERVSLKFSETDIGNTDLTDSKSVCKFAGKLVSQLKKAETNHKKRLSAARNLVCKKTGELLEKKLVSNLSNCLRKARRDARASNNAEAQKQANDDASKFDNNALKRVLKLLDLMKKKCLMIMKDTPESKPVQVSGVFSERLKTKIKRKKSGALTEAEKQQIAKKFNEAVEKKYPSATNIETTVTETAGRRQLSARRALAAAVVVETKWDVDTPPKAADNVNVQLGDDFTSDPPEMSSQPTTVSIIEETQAITPIDTNLPDGEDDSATKKPVNEVDAVKQASTGAQEVAFGATAVICATMWLF